jgi:hypothetical protein
MWSKLQRIFAWIVASTPIEANYDRIAYHASARADELRFSQTSSLRRYY